MAYSYVVGHIEQTKPLTLHIVDWLDEDKSSMHYDKTPAIYRRMGLSEHVLDLGR
jgi:hypothetical protein